MDSNYFFFMSSISTFVRLSSMSVTLSKPTASTCSRTARLSFVFSGLSSISAEKVKFKVKVKIKVKREQTCEQKKVEVENFKII